MQFIPNFLALIFTWFLTSYLSSSIKGFEVGPLDCELEISVEMVSVFEKWVPWGF